MVPDAALRRFQNVEGPEPEDIRPLAERFPPGTWIEQDHFGPGVVLGSEEGSIESINVLFSSRVVRIAEGAVGKGSVIWKLDRNPLDFSKSWGRRWASWRQYNAIFRRPVCVSCGYPNLGSHTRETAAPRVCIICGYPEFGLGIFEKANNLCVGLVGTHWWRRHMWQIPEEGDLEFVVMGEPDTAAPTDEDSKTTGYSLSEARRNFESWGVMFRPDTPSALMTEVATALRRSLVRLLEKATAEPPQWHYDDRRKAEKIGNRILAELAKAKDCP